MSLRFVEAMADLTIVTKDIWGRIFGERRQDEVVQR